MDIRFVTEQDKKAIIDMWDYCFEDKDPFLSWYFEEKYRASNTLAVYENDIPVSSVQLLPYKLSFHGTVLDVSYIVGAATLPEARAKGYMEALLQKSIQVMQQRKHTISILLPFKYSFYRKYGWETCYYHKNYNIEISNLKPLIQKYGKLRPAKMPDDIEVIMNIYYEFMKEYNGYIVRSKRDWSCILQDHAFEEGKVYILEGEGGKAEGYILYSIKDKTFNAHELGYTNPDAFKGLLTFVYAHSAQANNFVWRAPAADDSYIFLMEPEAGVALKPFVMVRIIDVQGILELLSKQAPDIQDLNIQIIDSFVEKNNGVFSIHKGKVLQNNNNVWDLKCSINTLSQMAMGFISPIQGYNMGILEVKNHEAMEKTNRLFNKQNNYINDYY